jgi:hypothetical protein
MSITINELCTDIRQISIRRNIAQKTRTMLENIVRGRVTQVFLDERRQFFLSKMDRREAELKVLEISKDKAFKKVITTVRCALVNPTGLKKQNGKSKANANAKIAALRKKYPEQMEAIEKSTSSILVGLTTIYADENMATDHLEELTEKLPVWQKWAKDVPGLGIINLGKMIGETGPLSGFHSKEGLYKYLGLGVFNGHAQGKIRGKMIKGDAAIPEGYCRNRLAGVLLIGQSVLKIGGKVSHKNDPYVKLLRIKLADYAEKAKVENKLVKKNNPKLKKDELFKLQTSKKTVMLRSIRWITKMIVRDLRGAWIACEGKGEMPNPANSPMLTGVPVVAKKPCKMKVAAA